IKIIESSLSIHYNQFYKVPSPENLIIGLHYRGYSASDIEIKYSNYLYSIFQFLQTTSTSLNSEDYKTPKGNHVLKQDYSSAIENINSYLIYEFQSLQATKTNDADCITFRMNEINMLYDTIENIKLQLKELRVLVEASVKESEDLLKKFAHSEEDLKIPTRVENDKIRKEFDDLDNFYKFGEHIIINGGVHCINGPEYLWLETGLDDKASIDFPVNDGNSMVEMTGADGL
ncbi:2784_t:CDS:2, partial [Dentiscutata erythropus]